MAAIGQTFFDLIDLYKSQDPKGQIAPVIEMLMQFNPILQDALTVQCNNGRSHLHTIRTGLPVPTWGKLYKGTPQGKSTKAQVEDATGFLEAMSTIDCRILELSGNEGAVRLSEAKAHLEAMSQEMADTVFYGNDASAPEEFMGLSPRFSQLSGVANSSQVINGGGAGSDNTSVWMVTWGESQNHLLHPQHTQAGVQRHDKGEQRVLDGSNDAYYVKEEVFRWHNGMAIKDWRYVVRVANIDVSDLRAGSVDIYDLLRQGYYKHYGRRLQEAGVGNGQGRTSLYCNAEVMEALDKQATNGGSSDNYVRLRPIEIQGKMVDAYRGFPVRECDALLNTESAVS